MLESYIKTAQKKIIHRFFVFVSILLLAYLLRLTLSELVEQASYLFLFSVLIALILAWTIPWIQIFRLNIFLVILCMLSLGNGLSSIISTKSNEIVGSVENESNEALYNQVTFSITPNVYYIVPDSYPNQDALEKIFAIDNSKFYQQLETLDFTLYHNAFSNYMNTTASVTSLFSMSHHFYKDSIGNFEMLNSREFIAGKNNPIVHIFKNNGYRVNYLHEMSYMFTRGCYVDLCSPSVLLADFVKILIPEKIESIPMISKARRRVFGILDLAGTPKGLTQRVLKYVDRVSTHNNPHFTYVHIFSAPNHSNIKLSTAEALALWRKRYFKKIQYANGIVTKLVQHILARDPKALIIINADHGAWGFGTYRWVEKEVLEGVPDDLITLDSLGVLLAIRWPDDRPKHDQDLRTNVNLFRYIFSYLSESADILTTKVPDDGYISKGRGKRKIVAKGIHDGEILKHMVEMDIVK